MGWDAPDPYNQPEKFGLEIILEGDRSSQCYEFSIFVGAVTQAALSWASEYWSGSAEDQVEFVSKCNDLRRTLA